MQNAVPIRVQLGSFEFDLKTGELRKNRRKIRLQEQPFQILLMLVEGNAVLWKDDHMLNLGTLGGYESSTNYVNDDGQVVGFATINATPDPYSFLGAPTHGFIWRDGVMQDLGTLGGPDSFPGSGGVNQRNGLVAGSSFTNDVPNPTTGLPTMDPFLWKDGHMMDLGTLGGTLCCQLGTVIANNKGQVVG